MRHKIISVFIACAMLFGICNISYADEQSVENSSLSEKDAKVINFINKMGFSADVFEEEPASQQKITRAEFAMLISHILGFDMPNAGEVFFEDILGDVDKSEIFITEDSVGEMRFSDVNEAHPAYSYIKYVSSLGLMTGTSEKTFSPDKNITVTESLKPLIKALNYTLAAELKGGYPSGYITVADELKLLKNVKQNIEDEATALSVYHLLYNALHTAIYEQTGYSLDNITFSSDRDLMLITKIFNVEIAEGVITDNGISSLTDNGEVGESGIMIGDRKLKLSDKSLWIRDYLGHKAWVYYYNDESDNADTVLYADLYDKERVVKIKSDNFEGIDGNVITYYENDRLKRANLVSIPYVLINGEAVSEYDDSIFNVDDGEITLISWDDSKFNVIAVDSYEYCMVSSVNAEDEIIYNKFRVNEENNLNVINLEDYDFVTIKDADGEEATIYDIAPNSILDIKRGERNITLKIAENRTDTIMVKSVSTDHNGQKVISDGEKEYKIVKKFDLAVEVPEIKYGKEYKLYLNRNGDAVWLESVIAEDEEVVAVLTKFGAVQNDETGEDEYFIKVYSGKEEFEKFTFDEKISINNERVKTENYIGFIKDSVGSLVKLKFNNENKIIAFTTPAEYGDRSDRGLYKMNVAGTKLNYRIDTYGFGTAFFKGSAPVISVPTDPAMYDDIYSFGYNRTGFENNIMYEVEGYTTTLDKKTADFIIRRENIEKGGSFSNKSIVVEEITQTLDEDDNPCYKISGYYGNYQENVSRKELLIEPDAIFVDYSFKEIDDYSISDIKPGDIIRFSTNSKGNITTLNMAYDYSTGESHSANTNQVEAHVIIGNAYSVNSSYLTVATGVLPEQIDYSEKGVQDKLKTYPAGNTKLVKIDTNSGKLKVSQGSQEDIVTYLSTRSAGAYSKVIVLAFWGYTPYLIAVYN